MAVTAVHEPICTDDRRVLVLSLRAVTVRSCLPARVGSVDSLALARQRRVALRVRSTTDRGGTCRAPLTRGIHVTRLGAACLCGAHRGCQACAPLCVVSLPRRTQRPCVGVRRSQCWARCMGGGTWPVKRACCPTAPRARRCAAAPQSSRRPRWPPAPHCATCPDAERLAHRLFDHDLIQCNSQRLLHLDCGLSSAAERRPRAPTGLRLKRGRSGAAYFP